MFKSEELMENILKLMTSFTIFQIKEDWDLVKLSWFKTCIMELKL